MVGRGWGGAWGCVTMLLGKGLGGSTVYEAPGLLCLTSRLGGRRMSTPAYNIHLGEGESVSSVQTMEERGGREGLCACIGYDVERA